MSGDTSTDRAQVLRRAFLEMKALQSKVEGYERARTEPVAIVGVGCRFPGHVNDPESYWRLLAGGVDAITAIPPDRWDAAKYYDPDPNAAGNKMYTRLGGFIDGVKEFDAAFFGITPREAAMLDPQQRLLLETAWEALENGGIAPESIAETATGVFVGMCGFDYPQLLLGDKGIPIDGYMGSGSTHSAASGRLSYFLGVHGPCLSVDTACSSSLVSVHLAMQSLRSGECNLALAGGVNLLLIPETTIIFSKAKMMSPDGRCKTFDARADGYVRSEGCGMVVLKRLSDAERDGDNVLAVIRGSAVNQDGRSSGLTVPNGMAQEEVLRAALRNAGVEPGQVGYVEAHGTGTSLGDPIELRALSAVLNEGRAQPYTVGSVKTNFGHLEGAAGVASLIKVALALRHGTIPPHLHFETPNPLIDWDHANAVVPTRATPFEPIGGRRIAGVSSFGFSGTNAHLVLEEAPATQPLRGEVDRPVHVLALSARTEDALRDLIVRYRRHLAESPDRFADICFTANAGRSHFAHRLAVVAGGKDEAISLLRDAVPVSRKTTGRLRIAFVFPGPAGVSEAELWRSWGVEPSMLIGPGAGENAAAAPRLPVIRELTDEALRTSGCDAFIEIHAGEPDWVRICQSLAMLYTTGAAINWKAFDNGHERRRVVLPTYPFQRETHWVEPSALSADAPGSDSLIGRGFDSPALAGQRIYETVLSAEQPSFLGEHRISGHAVLPATAYIAMALRNEGGVLEDLVLYEPLVFPEGQTRRVQVIVNGDDVRIFGSGAAGWVLHAQGRLGTHRENFPAPDVPAAVQRLRSTGVKLEAPYDALASKGLQLGPCFRGVTGLWRGDGEAVGEIQLPRGFEAEAARDPVHPILLDACLDRKSVV